MKLRAPTQILFAVSCTCLVLAETPSSKQTPTPDQGAVDAGGRFVPATARKGEQPAPMTREQAEAALRKDLKIEKVSETQMRIGEVTLDRTARTVRFRAVVNMTKGPVEYALVTENGKRHESIFTTKVSPRDIHLAMLLLGLRPDSGRQEPDGGVKFADESSTSVSVEWETNGPPRKHPLASMVALADESPDQPVKRTLKDGPWIYTGSTFDGSGFVTVRDGSIISLIGDPAALVGNPGKERGNDDIHVPNEALLPPVGMPVTIVMSCPPTRKADGAASPPK